MARLSRVASVVLLMGLAACSGTDIAQMPEGDRYPSSDWSTYGGDGGSAKYSVLDEINAETVGGLEVAWVWESADYGLLGENPNLRINPNFQSTPIKVGNRLYTSTNLSQIAAIDPATGETLWVHNPWEQTGESPAGRANRGVAYWPLAADGPSDGVDANRIFSVFGTHLAAVNAETGEVITSFGNGGNIDLSEDINERVTTYRWTSAPVVVGDVVIVGGASMAPDRRWKTVPPTYIRGYDVRTGELIWRFSPIPEPGEAGSETWLDGSLEYSGDAGAWTLLSADVEKGLLYLPLKTTTNDWYGGARPGNNLYGESLVCIRADTGEIVWHFQLVHHGLWDYDPPAAPIVADIVVDGREIEAVLQVTKQAFVFAFDRVTGEPVWPIEEKAVPSGNVPGEWYAATQPFPTKPAPFDLQGITEDDVIDFTPKLRSEAMAFLDDFVWGEMFTPPTLLDESPGGTKGTILVPGWVGGANWNGAAFDPETAVLYIPSVTSPSVTALVVPENFPDSSDHRFIRGLPREVPMPQGLPILKPPYGRITAIDMNSGDHTWMVPNGPGPRDHPALAGLDVPWLGQRGRPAPLLTKSLLFLGEGSEGALSILPVAGGDTFRAYDKVTGDVVWEMDLEAGTSGAPMTYTANGRQYIVVAIGDADVRGQYVALALP